MKAKKSNIHLREAYFVSLDNLQSKNFLLAILENLLKIIETSDFSISLT